MRTSSVKRLVVAYRVVLQISHACTLRFMEMGAIAWATLLRILSSMIESLEIGKQNQQTEVLFLGTLYFYSYHLCGVNYL